MSKFLRTLVLAMLVVLFTAGGAMAAASMANTSKVIDYKMMSGDTWLVSAATLQGAGVVIGYTVGTAINKDENFTLTLTNASWGQSGTIYLGGATTSNVASCTPVVAQKTCLFTALGTSAGQAVMHAGATYTMNITANNGNNQSPPALLVKSGFLSSDTVTVGITAGTATTADATATNILTASAATTLTLTGVSDATSGARVINASNGRLTFVTGVGGNTKGAKTTLTFTNANLAGTLIGADTTKAGFKNTLTITGNFTGVASVSFAANASTSAPNSSAATMTLTNQVCATAACDLIFTVIGTTGNPLTPRTFTITASSTAQAERSDPMALAYGTSGMTTEWTSNGYSAIVPGLVYDPTGAYFTSCTLNNPTTDSTQVDVDLLNAYTGVTAGVSGTSYFPTVLTIPAGKTARLTFGEGGYKGIKARLWSSDREGTPTDTPMSTLGDSYDRYSVKITMTGAAVTAVTASCVQRDGVDRNRAIPVLTPDAASPAAQPARN